MSPEAQALLERYSILVHQAFQSGVTTPRTLGIARGAVLLVSSKSAVVANETGRSTGSTMCMRRARPEDARELRGRTLVVEVLIDRHAGTLAIASERQ